MKINNEIKIGIMVCIVLMMLAVITIKTGEISFSKKGYEIKVLFENIDGVDVNAPVMLNGFEKGFVKDINISDDGEQVMMELTVWLEEQAKLREGAEGYVKNMGFMGEKYVGLTSGKSGGAYLQEGAVIVGEKAGDIDKLLSDGQEIAANIKEISININERLKKNQENIDNIITNLNTSMKKIVSITDNLDERLDKNRDNIDEIFANLRTTTENLDERLKVNKENIDKIFVNLESASVNLDQFTYDLKQNPWKLMYRPKEQRERNALKARD